ncbi:MAG: CopD family protein [Propionivibrio sp.]
MHGLLLLLHILAATVWTGGHLVLALTILPRALKTKSVDELSRFESAYERIGIPALLVQVATGLWLAVQVAPDVAQWFAFADPVARLVGVKIVLLLTTIAFAADARLRVIPRLSANNLQALAWHVFPVTLVSVLFVIIGVSFRTGWFY